MTPFLLVLAGFAIAYYLPFRTTELYRRDIVWQQRPS